MIELGNIFTHGTMPALPPGRAPGRVLFIYTAARGKARLIPMKPLAGSLVDFDGTV